MTDRLHPIAILLAAILGITGYLDVADGTSTAAIKLVDNAFPDLSGYPEANAGEFTVMDPRNYFGGTVFNTPDGQSCGYNVRDGAHRLFCYGPRPDKGGYWNTSFSADTAATTAATEQRGSDWHPENHKTLPAGHKIEFDGFVCGVDAAMTACRAGGHGFVFTATSTTLF